jgi:L-aminopeptidase/D-esterase-like protein
VQKPVITNDNSSLTPYIPGEADGHGLRFDFPGLQAGVAEYKEGPTGCTIIYFGGQVVACSVDVRGGSHGTTLTEGRDQLHAICLAGGSVPGLESTAGVVAELFAMRGYATGWTDIPLVSGGIIFDYNLRRENAIYPDKALGRAAMRSAREGWFPLGAHGAGCSATVGKGLRPTHTGEPSGQGAAFRQFGATRIAVFTVVNAVGAIVDREGQVVRGNLDPVTGEHHHLVDGLERNTANPQEPAPAPTPGNTTLTVVVTNQKLNADRGLAWSLRQFARMVHTSMARAIQPFQTVYDGDVLWAVSTEEVENEGLNDVGLGALASEVAWDAVLSCYKG